MHRSVAIKSSDMTIPITKTEKYLIKNGKITFVREILY